MLRIISLNIWGLGYHISKDREQRIRALGEALHNLRADLIGFQEVWVNDDRQYLIRQAAASGLGYAHYFSSGLLGSGLLTLSRYPIVDVAFYAYRLKGRPDTFEGDFYAGKGIGLTRVETPQGMVDFYNTHAVAQYAPDYQDQYGGSRSANMYEAANFINDHSTHNPAILVGDFNVNPRQSGYKLILAMTGLTDTYEALHPDDASITFSLNNPYNRNYREPDRIDYVCVRDGEELALQVAQAEIILKHQPEYPFNPYSDHYAMQVDVEIEKASAPRVETEPEVVRAVLETLARELQVTLDQAVQRRDRHRFLALLSFGASLLLNPHRPSEFAGRIARSWGAALVLNFALLQALLYMLFVPEEIQNLKAITKEVRVKIVSLRERQPAVMPSVNGKKR